MGRIDIVVASFALLAGLALTVGASPPRGRCPFAAPSALPAQRVVVLPNLLAAVATLEAGVDRLGGASKASQTWAMDGLISHVYPAIAGLPLAGAAGLAEPERLLQLRADAVVVAFNQAEQLRQDGFTRLAETRFDSRRPIDSRLETWSRVGAALGDSGRTASLSRKFQDDLAAVARQCPPGVPPPRAVFINMTAGYWALAGSNYYGAYRIAAAGGINAAAALRTFDRENLEQLLLLDPDIILFTANTSDQAITREVLADPVFRVLRAVRDRRFYQFPEHAFMNELVEDRILLTWLAEVFYLDALPRRTRQVFKETYREVYGYELSEAEIDRALFMETNRGAFGYERFAAASPETGKQP